MLDAAHSPAPSRSGNLPVTDDPRFSWSGYLRQWQAIFTFYGVGLSFTLRHLLAPTIRDAGQMAAHTQTSRIELARACREYFSRLQEWGIMRLDDRDLLPFAQAKGQIFAANHPTLFDAFLLLGRIPNLNCVMRASLLRDPCLRGGALRCGFIPNDGGADFVRQAVAKLAAGENLLIFPEGTRTVPPAPLNSFKSGLALVAKKSGTPIQTCFLEVDQPVLGKKQPLGRLVRYPVTFRVRTGEILDGQVGEKTEDFTRRLHEYFLHKLQERVNPVEDA
jgi:1-acyl-sn-glycerol-3-phosphate acyltransferase